MPPIPVLDMCEGAESIALRKAMPTTRKFVNAHADAADTAPPDLVLLGFGTGDGSN